MKQEKRHAAWEKRLINILSAAIALTFFIAAYHMVNDWAAHQQRMREQVFSDGWAYRMAWILPISYGLVGAAISFRPSQGVAIRITLCYVVILTVYLVLAKYKVFGMEVCSCIGFKSGSSFNQNLLFNGKLLAAILLAVALERRWLVKIGVSISTRWGRWRKEGSTAT